VLHDAAVAQGCKLSVCPKGVASESCLAFRDYVKRSRQTTDVNFRHLQSTDSWTKDDYIDNASARQARRKYCPDSLKELTSASIEIEPCWYDEVVLK
jgi:hypothetical protein